MDKAVLKLKLTLLCSILLVIILVGGTSYAYFNTSATDTKTQTITASNCASITFESNNNSITSSYETGDKSFDNLWNNNDYYIFKITNKCAHEIKVNIGLENQSSTTIDLSSVYAYVNRLTEYNQYRKATLGSATRMTTDSGTVMYNVYTDYLPANGSESYRMNIDYKSSNSTINKTFKGKVVAIGSIVTWSSYNYTAPDPWFTSSSGTLLYALRNDTANQIKSPISTPGLENSAIKGSTTTTDGTIQMDSLAPYDSDWDMGLGGKTIYYSASRTKNADGTYSLVNPQSLVLSNTNLSGTLNGKYITFEAKGGDVFYVNNVKIKDSGGSNYFIYYSYQSKSSDLSADEAIMAMEPDEYSVSYYYRGNVKNNYVQFANMCWRIVRVMGNGAIKLVLENGDSSSCSTSNPLIKSSGSIQLVTYGTSKNSSYKGSNAETVINTWVTNNLSSYTSYLEDIIWCSDVSSRNPKYLSSLYDNVNHIAYSGVQKFNRYVNDEVPRPTFNCPEGESSLVNTTTTKNHVNYNETNSGYDKTEVTTGLKSKVGMLTTDEMLFAGASIGYSKNNVKVNIGNQKFYLYSSAVASYPYYTMTPAAYSSNTPYVYGFFNGNLSLLAANSDSAGIRPALALKSTAKISGGNGTASNPYVISGV